MIEDEPRERQDEEGGSAEEERLKAEALETEGVEEAVPEDEAPGEEGATEASGPPEAEAEDPGVEPEADGGPASEGAEERIRERARSERQERVRDEVVPGADLEPDLVLDEPDRDDEAEFAGVSYAERYAEPGEVAPEAPEQPAEETPEEEARREEAPAPRTPRELAADARYQATGKRKTAVARVILRPGSGTYTVNGAPLEDFFPRHALRKTARQPLMAAGYEANMDVVARLHGGGVSAQAGALRHGIARALADADPALRGEMKRRGYLTRDPRVKERKKAGLKKARKRPQFSKR